MPFILHFQQIPSREVCDLAMVQDIPRNQGKERKVKNPNSLTLWDAFNVELHGPVNLQRNKKARGCATDLIKTCQYVLRECLKDCQKESPILKQFKLRIDR